MTSQRLPALRRNLDARQRDSIVLWTHLGLGDQICMAQLIEFWASGGRHVVLPVKPRNAVMISDLYAYLPTVEVCALPSDDPREERESVRKLARDRQVLLVTAGHELLKPVRRRFPDIGLNRALARCGLLWTDTLQSHRLREHVLRQVQMPPPSEPFAFVDQHIPGRPIPRDVIARLEVEGLRVIANPREVPLASLFMVMDRAQEAHYVSSAPLCLALTCGARSAKTFHYMTDPRFSAAADFSVPLLEIPIWTR